VAGRASAATAKPCLIASVIRSLGPFHGAIAVPSVTRCCCRRRRGHRLAHAAAHSGELAQHFSNASCFYKSIGEKYLNFAKGGSIFASF